MKRMLMTVGVVLFLAIAVAAYAEYGSWTVKFDDWSYNNAMFDISAATYDDFFTVGIWTDNISTFQFIWRSNDGGDTVENIYQWVMSPDPSKMCEMLKITDARTAVHMSTADVGLFGGSGVSQACIDQFGPDPGQQMLCMMVCAATIGPSIWFTDDGGDTFNEAEIPYVNQASVQSIHMLDELTGYAGGLGSYVIKTTDGGQTWTQLPELYSESLYVNRVFFIDEDTGWLSIGTWDAKQKVEMKSMDLVRDHVHKMMLSANPVYRHEYWKTLDPDKAGKMTSGAVLKTTDGGQTWETQMQSGSEGYDFIYFIDANNGWLIGDQYTAQGNLLKLYRTTDGGETWNDVTNTLPPSIPGAAQGWYPTGVKFINPGFGIMYGMGASLMAYKPAILYTYDGGETWTVDESVTADNGGQFGFYWVDNTVAYSVGVYLNVMRYDGTNAAPTANAGDDFTVEVGELANLDGTGSTDPDGDGLFCNWEQVSGVTLTLDDNTAIQPSFTATEEGIAIFQLGVYDGMYAGDDLDEVEVTIVPATADDDDDDVGGDDDDDDDDTGDDDDDAGPAEGDEDGDDTSSCGC